jgi:hypothetical protein
MRLVLMLSDVFLSFTIVLKFGKLARWASFGIIFFTLPAMGYDEEISQITDDLGHLPIHRCPR